MKKVLAFLLAAMLMIACMAPAMAASNKYGYDIDSAKSSVVRIWKRATFIDDRLLQMGNIISDWGPSLADLYGRTYEATGSGFAVGSLDDSTVQYIVTAGHVLCHNLGYGDIKATSVGVPVNGVYYYFLVRMEEIRVLLTDRSGYILAQDAGVSDRADVAVLRLNQPISQRRPAVLLDEKNFATSTPLTTMGFPSVSDVNSTMMASDQLIATVEAMTLGRGFFSRFSAHAVTGEGDQIQTNAVSDNGMSGGALVNDDGYVVGVVVSGAASNNTVNYAVATSEIIRLLNSLTDCKYMVAPLPPAGLSTTAIILIAAGVLIVILLIVLIISSSKAKKNKRVLVFGGALAGKTFELKPGAPLVVGRDPKTCKAVYPQDTPAVSKSHCTITFDGKEVVVADNGSSYGTFVGGVKVEPGKPMVMHRGQAITFGSDKNPAELH